MNWAEYERYTFIIYFFYSSTFQYKYHSDLSSIVILSEKVELGAGDLTLVFHGGGANFPIEGECVTQYLFLRVRLTMCCHGDFKQ